MDDVLAGNQAKFGHDPPIYLRSMTATRIPSPAKVRAAIVDPVPPQGITRSKSSNCDSLDRCPDEVLLVLFMMFPLQKVLHRDR